MTSSRRKDALADDDAARAGAASRRGFAQWCKGHTELRHLGRPVPTLKIRADEGRASVPALLLDDALLRSLFLRWVPLADQAQQGGSSSPLSSAPASPVLGARTSLVGE